VRELDVKTSVKRATLVGLAALMVGEYVATHRREATDTETLLAAAGFQVRPADTPERLAHCEAMPPLKLVARTRDGEFRYTFADPYKCRCLYIGGPKEYAAYQRLVEREQAAEFASGAGSIRWGLEGP
jgi:hypothetical protein